MVRRVEQLRRRWMRGARARALASSGGRRRALLYLFTDLLLFGGPAEVLGGDGPRFRRDEAVDALFFVLGFVLLLAAVARSTA